MKRAPSAPDRGSQEAGFTQPKAHSFAQPCTRSGEILCQSLLSLRVYLADETIHMSQVNAYDDSEALSGI